MDQPRIVVGFHGTSRDGASTIQRDGFQVSSNDYDWLGSGVYFFEDAPGRAGVWAGQRFGGDAAVVGAEIDLTDSMDLLDVRWASTLADAYNRYLELVRDGRALMPRQTGGAHRLDRAVIDYCCAILEESGIVIPTVRAAFSEGEPVFPGSALMRLSHVQIAVRRPSAVRRVWIHTGGDIDE